MGGWGVLLLFKKQTLFHMSCIHRQLGLPLHCDGARIFHAVVRFLSAGSKFRYKLKDFTVFMLRNILACRWQSYWSNATLPPSVFQRCKLADEYTMGNALTSNYTLHNVCAIYHDYKINCMQYSDFKTQLVGTFVSSDRSSCSYKS